MVKDCGVLPREETPEDRRQGETMRTLALSETPQPQFPPEPRGPPRVTGSPGEALHGGWSTERGLRRVGDGLKCFFWVAQHEKVGTLQPEQVKTLMTLTLPSKTGNNGVCDQSPQEDIEKPTQALLNLHIASTRQEVWIVSRTDQGKMEESQWSVA